MSDTDKIREVFAAIRDDLWPVDVLFYSASSRCKAQGSQGNIEACTEEDMERAWKIDTLSNWEILYAGIKCCEVAKMQGGFRQTTNHKATLQK